MVFFANLSIRNKVVTAFSAILVLTVLLGLFAITRVRALDAHVVSLVNNTVTAQPLDVLARDANQFVELTQEGHALSALTPAQLAALPPNTLQTVTGSATAASQDFDTVWAAYQQNTDSGREADDATAMKADFEKITATASEIADADGQGDHVSAADLLATDMTPALAAFTVSITDDMHYQIVQDNGFANGAAAASTHGVLWISIILAVIAAGTIAVGLLIVSSIATPISHMTEAMRKLARHDMKVKIPGIGRKDEVGAMAEAVQVFKENGEERLKLEAGAKQFQKQLDQKLKDMEAAFEASGHDQKHVVEALAAALAALAQGDLTSRLFQEVANAYQTLKADFNAAMDTLQATMTSIAASTHNVRSGAGEITTASDDLARRTEQQAANLEQTAAALDEITAAVRKTAEGAGEARVLASQSKADAEHSGSVVHQTVQAMSSIDNSSREISNIIGVIDEIAFQTNLLALNAGVEAARAGDAGRGFAVVATEVRALAQRSADAAKEIKILISTSRAQVESGVKLVDETGTALGRIVAQVTKLNELIAGIAASATEQATGLNEVNSAVNQMDQVTQQNAAMVEQSTAASHSLEAEAAELARLIGQFSTSTAAPAPAYTAPHRAAPAKPRIPAHAPSPKTRPAPPSAAPRTAMPVAAQEDWDEF